MLLHEITSTDFEISSLVFHSIVSWRSVLKELGVSSEGNDVCFHIPHSSVDTSTILLTAHRRFPKQIMDISWNKTKIDPTEL